MPHSFDVKPIDASFGDATALRKGLNWVGRDPLPPDELELMGDLVIGRARSPFRSVNESKRDVEVEE